MPNTDKVSKASSIREYSDFISDDNEPDSFLFEETPDPTLNLSSLFSSDVAETGSFDMRGVQKTTFARLLNALPVPALLLENNDMIFFMNQSLSKIRPDLVYISFPPFSALFVKRDDAERCLSFLRRAFAERRPQVAEGILARHDGNILWGRIHMRSVRMGKERFVLVLIEDLTEEKKRMALSKHCAEALTKTRDQLEERVRERTSDLMTLNEELRREIAARKSAEESLSLAANVVASSNEAILITDTTGNIVDVNPAFTRITGYSREEVLGKNPRIMSSGRHKNGFWRHFWRSLKETGQWTGEVWDRRKNGDVFPKLLSVSAIKGPGNSATHYVAIFSDISVIKKSEERLAQLAHFDPLTHLPNRLLFRDRFNGAVIRAERERQMVALMFVDLDDFKSVNDTIGHIKGDELLVAVAKRLKDCVRGTDTVARLGGDEFTIIMPDVTGPRDVIPLAQRITEALSKPFDLKDTEIFTAASIGISLYPSDGLYADRLVQHADTAMYHAKSQGKNNFQFFSQEMNIEINRLVDMELTLRRAMELENLLIYYQPVVDCKTGVIVGAESLLRLKDLSGEVISAGPYISVAEGKGLIVPIGEKVLRTVCEQNKAWRNKGLPPIRVSTNISMRQLREPMLVETFLAILEETGCDPNLLELELTETTMMANKELAIKMLNELRQRGVTVTLDDFGVGYSSLSCLRNLPVDKLKIDKSFVDSLTSNSTQRALVQAIVNVAHSLDMKVVAEGIEFKEQLRVLCELGCDAWQGYHFAHALPAEEFEILLKEDKMLLPHLA
jgi:diguanylate cyclase (GGDEF)-like protein/PAS domain S-box-containing protein